MEISLKRGNEGGKENQQWYHLSLILLNFTQFFHWHKTHFGIFGLINECVTYLNEYPPFLN